MSESIINVVIAGLGGQGVLKISDILADVAVRASLDVKKSELHGMSQRGGSVSSDVRMGKKVWSPMVPAGEADYLVLLQPDQLTPNRHALKEGGVAIDISWIDESKLANKKSLNVALLGVLSCFFPWEESLWHEALRSHLPGKLLEINLGSFALGRSSEKAAAQV